MKTTGKYTRTHGVIQYPQLGRGLRPYPTQKGDGGGPMRPYPTQRGGGSMRPYPTQRKRQSYPAKQRGGKRRRSVKAQLLSRLR